MTRTALVLALAGAGAFACSRSPEAPPALRVLDWSGRDGVPVPLDQPLVLTFSEPLRGPVRPSSVILEGASGILPEAWRLEARGSLLLLHPHLPLRPDLHDAGLPPASSLRLRLAGLPRLNTLAGESGATLVGDQVLEFRTVSADEPAALSGFPTAGAGIRPLGLGDSGLLRLPGRREGPAQIRFSGALDPRSLREPARLWSEGEDRSTPGTAVPLRLTTNRPEESTLELELGDWTGRGVLHFPAALEGPGGRRIDPATVRLRIWRAP